jgi:predicted anti-sigma-YlaC factor YlaD
MMSGLRGLLTRIMPGNMSCETVDGFIADYLDGALPANQLKVFERHLGMCAECRAYLDAYKTTIELGRACLGGAPDCAPEPMPEELVKAILAAKDARP